MKRSFSILILLFMLFAFIACKNSNDNTYLITNFGAKGDSLTLNTKAIQSAIDEAYENGGGRVIVPSPGKFISGTIRLKDNITFEIQAGASLIGSDTISDYIPYQWENFNKDVTPYHLIIAKDANNVTLEGRGTINGRGWHFWEYTDVQPRWMNNRVDRPSPMVSFENCTNAKIRDVFLTNSAGWTVHLLHCNHVEVNGIRIVNNLFGPNNDGIDINGSTNIIISNCYIKTCDDAICVKAYEKEAYNIVATNNILQTLCVALKIDENFKKIHNIAFNNCIITKSSRGLAIYAVHGGDIENVVVDNIICDTNAPLVLNRPIQISAWDRKEGDSILFGGFIRNVTISNFIATTEGRILITSNQGKKVENVTLRDIKIKYPFIENPLLYTPTIQSGQFKGMETEAKNALAAVVASNLKNFVIDGLQIDWPHSGSVPDEWKFPERLENGNKELIHRPDYSFVKQNEFSALKLIGCEGGYVFAPLASSSNISLPQFVIENSTIKIIR